MQQSFIPCSETFHTVLAPFVALSFFSHVHEIAKSRFLKRRVRLENVQKKCYLPYLNGFEKENSKRNFIYTEKTVLSNQ